MSELLRFFKDMRDNGYGLAEIAAQLGTSAIAEPVAGFAAMYDPQHGADAIREGMTYQPRTQEAQEYSQSIGNAAKTAIKPAMPIIDTWKKGVDIAGQYSPVVGAGLRTVPTAIGIAMGAKPALQAGRQVSEGLGAMQGRMIANANAPRTLNTGFRGQRGVFAGINALTADRQALAKAQEMIARGDFPDDVWQETGWGRGADGKWRFEINDKFDVLDDGSLTGSHLNTDGSILGRLANNEIGVARARQVLNHDDLYAAYPDLAMTSVRPSKTTTGAFNPDNNTITLNAELLRRAQRGQEYGITDNAHSVALHEMQHAIQQREGFASGGSPDQFKGLYNDPKEAYSRLAGEIESRSVQNRMELSPQQRRDIYPFAVGRYGYEDIPKDKQIISFGNNKANAQRPLTEFEQAHLLAQQRAALPVNQRGLDLPANNTAMDRARAMGFDVDNPVFHGTGADIEAFDPKLLKETSQYMKGVFTTDKPDIASNYGDTVYPLVQKQGYTLKDKRTDRASGKTPKEVDTIRDKDKNIIVTTKPENIRSRFAAFDPFNRESSNLLAQSAKLAPTTALGAYMYNEKRKKSQGNQ